MGTRGRLVGALCRSLCGLGEELEQPKRARRIAHAQAELRRIDDPATAALLDRLGRLSRSDGVDDPISRTRPDVARIEARLDRLRRAPEIEPLACRSDANRTHDSRVGISRMSPAPTESLLAESLKTSQPTFNDLTQA